MSDERTYIHGYTEWEQNRLLDQNDVLAKYIYKHLDFSTARHAFEIGSGVGAQMLYLLDKYPLLKITGIDIDPLQIAKAAQLLQDNSINPARYRLVLIDSNDDSWLSMLKDEMVDVIYTVWVLEHVVNPRLLIKRVFDNCLVGTRFFATETFHKSFNIFPYHSLCNTFWNKMMENQLNLGGDPNVGLLLGNYFNDAGFNVLRHQPFPLLFDANNITAKKEIVDYWINLMLAAKESMILSGDWHENEWQSIRMHMESLQNDREAVFYYSFMQIESIKI